MNHKKLTIFFLFPILLFFLFINTVSNFNQSQSEKSSKFGLEKFDNLKIDNYEIYNDYLSFDIIISFDGNYEINNFNKENSINDFYFTMFNTNENKEIRINNLDSITTGNGYWIYEVVYDEFNDETNYIITFENIEIQNAESQGIIKYDELTFVYDNKTSFYYEYQFQSPEIQYIKTDDENFSNDEFIFSLIIDENDFNYEDIKFYEYENNEIYQYNYEILNIENNIYTFKISNMNNVNIHNFYINLGYTFISYDNVLSTLTEPTYVNDSFSIYENSAYNNQFEFSIKFSNSTNYDLNNIILKSDVDLDNDGYIDEEQVNLNLQLIEKDSDDYVYYYKVSGLEENATYLNFKGYFIDGDLIFEANDEIKTNTIEEDNINFQVSNITEESFDFKFTTEEEIDENSLNDATLNATLNNDENVELNISFISSNMFATNEYEYNFEVNNLNSNTIYSDFILNIPNSNIFNTKITSTIYVKTLNEVPIFSSLNILESFTGPQSFRFFISVQDWNDYDPNNFDLVLVDNRGNEIKHEIYFQDQSNDRYYFMIDITDPDYWHKDITIESIILNDSKIVDLDETSNNEVLLKSSTPIYVNGTLKISDVKSNTATLSFGYYQEGQNTNTPYELFLSSTTNSQIVKMDIRFIKQEDTISQISYDIYTYEIINLKPNEEYTNLNFYLGGQNWESDQTIETEKIINTKMYLIYIAIAIVLIIGIMYIIKKNIDKKLNKKIIFELD